MGCTISVFSGVGSKLPLPLYADVRLTLHIPMTDNDDAGHPLTSSRKRSGGYGFEPTEKDPLLLRHGGLNLSNSDFEDEEINAYSLPGGDGTSSMHALPRSIAVSDGRFGNHAEQDRRSNDRHGYTYSLPN